MNGMMIQTLKKLVPSSWRKHIRRHLLDSVDYYLTVLPELLSVEYNFWFRRRAIQKELETLRQLPRNLHIEGTNVCNAKCVFCAYPQMQRAKTTMPLQEFQRIVDEYVAMGGRYVSLTPIVGDPFVDSHLFERLDDLDRRPQIQGFDFYTNGILMKPSVSSRLLNYQQKLHIHLSFGGFDRATYRTMMGVDYFDLVCRNIEALMAAKRASGSATRISLALRCPRSRWLGPFWEQCQTYEQDGLLDMHFVGHFDSWAGKVKDVDLQRVGLDPVPPPYKRGACELLYLKPVILADGRVNACACRDVEAELIVGDLKQSSLVDVWDGHPIATLIQQHERGDFPEVCQRCTWYTSVYNLQKRHARINQTAIAANQSSTTSPEL